MAVSLSVSLDSIFGDPNRAIVSNLGISEPSGISRRSQFMSMLEQWESSIAMPFLWALVFDIPLLVTDLYLNYWGEQINQSQWGIDKAVQALNSNSQNHPIITGCMFAQSVNIPGESVDIDYIGSNNRGFTYSPIVTHRRAPVSIGISMLETNVSFVDSIIRPWIILVSHLGLIARQGRQDIKTNIQIYQLAKNGIPGSDLSVRKSWLFTGCAPMVADPSTQTYSPDSGLQTRETTWFYTRYQVTNVNG